MNTMKFIIGLIVLTLSVGLSGCAGQYHQYPCGCVHYGYCPPAPLAYSTYCGCPTPIASKYASGIVAKPVTPDSEEVD